MAYDTQELIDRATEIAQDNPTIIFMADIIALLGICEATFYSHIKKDSKELKALKEIINSNRVDIKMELRASMREGNSAEKIALYKLVGTEEERDILNMNKVDHTTKGDKIQTQSIQFFNSDGEEID